MSHVVIIDDNAPRFYGGVKAFWDSHEHEVILEGPYETGKTYGALCKLHALLSINPNTKALMVRNTRVSLLGSAVRTYEDKVLKYRPTENTVIKSYGGERPEFYLYPNGSRLLVGGLDNADKYLSAEYDYIYINQAEEIRLEAYEQLVGRATGRSGNAPWPHVMSDCNPSGPYHWILQRPTLRRHKTVHQDNPTLFNRETGEWTERGKLTVERLKSMTGLRYQRGYLGLWVSNEGQVYEFDDMVHHIDPFDIPRDWRRLRAIDFGFTNPFVCQWWAIDPDDRYYMYREIYMTQRTVRAHAEQINALSAGERYEANVADHDAEDRATLEEHGIKTIPADKRVTVGIEKVQERLRLRRDGKPGMMFFRNALVEEDKSLKEAYKPTCTVEEFGGYVWQPTRDGVAAKEAPLKINDHGMDTARYVGMYKPVAPPAPARTGGPRIAVTRPAPSGFDRRPTLPGMK